MDETRIDSVTGEAVDRPDVSSTTSQTGNDTDGRSPDYDVSLKDGADIVSDGVVRKPGSKAS